MAVISLRPGPAYPPGYNFLPSVSQSPPLAEDTETPRTLLRGLVKHCLAPRALFTAKEVRQWSPGLHLAGFPVSQASFPTSFPQPSSLRPSKVLATPPSPCVVSSSSQGTLMESCVCCADFSPPPMFRVMPRVGRRTVAVCFQLTEA